jgi:hypothetical protein
MSELGTEPISTPQWRQDAIDRVVSMYWDPEDTEPLIRVKRNASVAERAEELLDLLSEIWPEAAGPIRARSRIAPTTKLAVCLQRLSEIAPAGLEFREVSITGYDFATRVKARDNGKPETPAQARKRKPAATSGSKGPASDEAIKRVVRATEKPEDKPKPRTTKAKPTTTTKRTATIRKRTTK